MRMNIESKKRDVALVVDDSPETLRLLTDEIELIDRPNEKPVGAAEARPAAFRALGRKRPG